MSAYGGRNDHLFIGGVTESVWHHSYPPISDLEFQFQDFVTASGCASVDDMMACLRAKKTTELWTADVSYPYGGRTGKPLFGWGPTIDGHFVRKPLYEAFRAGEFVQIPLIIGYVLLLFYL